MFNLKILNTLITYIQKSKIGVQNYEKKLNKKLISARLFFFFVKTSDIAFDKKNDYSFIYSVISMFYEYKKSLNKKFYKYSNYFFNFAF